LSHLRRRVRQGIVDGARFATTKSAVIYSSRNPAAYATRLQRRGVGVAFCGRVRYISCEVIGGLLSPENGEIGLVPEPPPFGKSR
jgi:hypothetical protein